MNITNDLWVYGAPLEPYPRRPHATGPDGYHPVQFCTGYWDNYCPDPYNCPFGAVWVRKDHFDLVHSRPSTCRIILTQEEIRRAVVPFRCLPWEVPEGTCLLPQYAEALRETGPHYPRPYEAHHLAPYRRNLRHRVPTEIVAPAPESSTRAGTPRSPSSSSSGGGSVPPESRPVSFREITASQINVVTVASNSGKPEKKRVSLVRGSVLAVGSAPANNAAAAAAAEQPAPLPVGPSNQVKQEPTVIPVPAQRPTSQPASQHVSARASPVVQETASAVNATAAITCKWGACSLAFTDQRAALEHIKSDHIKSRKFLDYDFTCRIRGCPCGGKVFEKRDNIVSHVTNVAFDIRYAVCCFQQFGCPIALKREWDLPRHRKICKFRPEGYVTEVEGKGETGGGRKRKRGKENEGGVSGGKVTKMAKM